MKKKLLLNWLYYRPVGHVVEALKASKGYADANRNIEVHLVLNADSPIELVDACYWIKKTYHISLQDVWKNGAKSKSLKKVPKNWDYIIHDERIKHFRRGWDENNLIKAKKILPKLLHARIAEGYTDKHILPYKKNPKITLSIPRGAKEFAKRYRHAGPAICIMLGGSAGDTQSPTAEMWLKICKALFQSIPHLKIYFTGVTKSINGRTHTIDFSLHDIGFLVSHLPNAEAAYNIGLWNQLALIQKCDVFLSPHSGFGFLPPLVGTPWLTLSNCRWPEYMFNDVKFYSVLPECGSYPALEDTKHGCGKLLAKNGKARCMTDALLNKKIPEIVRSAKLLMNPRFTYKKAVQLHLRKINRPPYQFEKFFFFDGVDSL
ncbi:MAG: hypothetical protein HYT39_02055 [Candidatus Sungbacteria bacterium]|nr:hypothetical protein [Candidatus Sungbacteria bacterium]